MKLHLLPLAAFAAITLAFDTTIVNNGVNYEILGVPDTGATYSRAPLRFDKEHLVHFIRKNGGVKKGAKKKYPEVLASGNNAKVPPLQNGCNIADGNVYYSPIVINGKDSFAWLDPEAGKNAHQQSFRILYRIEAGRNALTYCATVEHQRTTDYIGCPSP